MTTHPPTAAKTLTVEQIEQCRKELHAVYDRTTNEIIAVNQLCDMALASSAVSTATDVPVDEDAMAEQRKRIDRVARFQKLFVDEPTEERLEELRAAKVYLADFVISKAMKEPTP